MPKAEAVKTMLCIFNSIEDGGNTVTAIIGEGIIPATLEMMDNLTIKAVEEAYHVGFPTDAAAILIIELDGLKDGMERLTERILDICRQNNVREIRVAKDQAERDKIWAGRKGAFGAVAGCVPTTWSTTEPSPGPGCRRRWPRWWKSGRNTISPSPTSSTPATEICTR